MDKEQLSLLPSWHLTQRQLCDLEMLMSGAFHPLTGFLNQKDYESVLQNMRLCDGSVWPMPITLDVTNRFADTVQPNDQIILRDQEGHPLAAMTISTIWRPNFQHEANAVFGTDDETHPGVNFLFHQSNPIYVGGQIKPLAMPTHYDFSHLRLSPAQLKATFKENGWKRVVAFQTRNPMHRAHQELTLRASKNYNAALLIHPVVGMTKPGDIDYFTRVRCYQKLINTYPKNTSILSLLSLAMRMGGPREALWHALIRKNHGCTHFIIGRDHAGPGMNVENKPFYGPYAAQELVSHYEDQIGIKMIPFQEMVYVKSKRCYMPSNEVADNSDIARISGTEFRRLLRANESIPSWFSYPEVIEELKKSTPDKSKQGFTIFFTGLSGSGKSTIAKALIEKLMESSHRSITLLDGDIVRKHLSSELGFSKAHRDLNVTRIGYVASEITKHAGIAICAPIAPYEQVRKTVRRLVSENGGFIEVHVSTPLSVCEARDPKGLYQKARRGLIKGFTGIDDPYEIPKQPELSIDTSRISVLGAVEIILTTLVEKGYLKENLCLATKKVTRELSEALL